MSNKLSIIMPFCGEYPQNIFTIMSVWNQFRGRLDIDWELIAINNWCDRAANQADYAYKCPKCNETYNIPRGEANSYRPPYKKQDPGGDRMQSYAAMHKWLKYVEYKDKLSHWNAKNAGIANSDGDILFFMDAHCSLIPNTLTAMYDYFVKNKYKLNGTLHMPLAYFLERTGKALVYKLDVDPDKCYYHYKFTRYGHPGEVIKVPCMSTCGMMMTRELYNQLGGWPKELGIYGGGENFINFTLAVQGRDVNIYPVSPLHHYAEKRGYNWEYVDHKRNQIIATYMFGGAERARKFSKHCKLDPKTAEKTVEDVIEKCADHRAFIEKSQVMTIEDWYEKWRPTNAI